MKFILWTLVWFGLYYIDTIINTWSHLCFKEELPKNFQVSASFFFLFLWIPLYLLFVR